MILSDVMARIAFKTGTTDDITSHNANAMISNANVLYELNAQMIKYANKTKGIQDFYSYSVTSNDQFLSAPTYALRSEAYRFAMLITRGWIKVSHLDRTRLKYDLTPDGMRVFTQRAMLYARDSLKVYGDYRKKAKKMAEELKELGISSVYIYGGDEIMDILRLTCIEAGLIINEIPDDCVLKFIGKDFQAILNSKKKDK